MQTYKWRRYRWLVLFPLITLGYLGFGQQATIQGNFPDPTVIKADGKYYAIGTSGEWAPHFPIYTSTDLQAWTQTGFVFEEVPEWGSGSVWAPEYFYQNGIYYVYYSARRKTDGVSCIGVATSSHPDRGFVDQGIVVAYGSESIDAFVVKDGSDLYMTWKAYGLDNKPMELVGSKLSPDGLRLEGDIFSLLMDTAHVGIEGQSFLKHDGYYYMFYSAGNCCGIRCDYHVQAVRSKSIRGPYERIGGDKLLSENDIWKCMGHGTFVQGPDDEPYYLFHGYHKIGFTYTGREGLLAKLSWLSGGVPEFTFLPAIQELLIDEVHLDFLSKETRQAFWQWDDRYAIPSFALTPNGLSLGGTITADNRSGVGLTLRPNSLHYELVTRVNLRESDDAAMKGLALFGARNAAIGVGVKQRDVVFWAVDSDNRQVIHLAEAKLPEDLPHINLKLVYDTEDTYHAFYEKDGEWIDLTMANQKTGDRGGIAQIGRSFRPGLHIAGQESERALFQYFTLKNLR